MSVSFFGTLCIRYKYYNCNHLAHFFLSFKTVITVDLASESSKMDAIIQLLLAMLNLSQIIYSKFPV